MKQRTIAASVAVLASLYAGSANAQNFEWVAQLGGSGSEIIYSTTVDGDGNVYSTGAFNGNIDVDPGAGVTELNSVAVHDILISKLDANGNFVWGRSFGGMYTDRGYSIATDASNNVYITGNFASEIDFDPGAGTNILTALALSDAFVLKLDANGDFVWAKRIGGNGTGTIGYNSGNSISIDNSGNLILTGSFQGTVDFDPGAGSTVLNSSSDALDFFALKLDASGNFIWVRTIGGLGADGGNYVDTDAAGNAYFIGTYQDVIDFDPGSGLASSTSAGADDIFVLKLDTDGNYVWAKSMGGAAVDYGNSLAVGAAGVYCTGTFQEVADFDPSTGVSSLTSFGNDDIFNLHLDADGNFIWVKQSGGDGWDFGKCIDLDSDGNIYTCGYFSGTADFDPSAASSELNCISSFDLYLQKLNADGSFEFAYRIGGGETSETLGLGLTVDEGNSVYCVGSFYMYADFDPSDGTLGLYTFDSYDAFVHKVSQNSSVGLKDRKAALNVSVYPNPSANRIHINCDVTIDKVLIYNTQGAIVQTEKSASFSIASLPTGVYTIEIQSAKGNAREKFCKE